jgi:hypothetical protein
MHRGYMLISHLYILHKRDNCALPGRNGENTGGGAMYLCLEKQKEYGYT